MSADRLGTLLAGLDRSLPYPHLILARWRYTLGQVELARVSLRHARRGPSRTAALALLLTAKLEEEAGEAAVALGLIREAQTLEPDLTEAWLAEARLLIALNQLAEAREIAKRRAPTLSKNTLGRELLRELGVAMDIESESSTVMDKMPVEGGL